MPRWRPLTSVCWSHHVMPLQSGVTWRDPENSLIHHCVIVRGLVVLSRRRSAAGGWLEAGTPTVLQRLQSFHSHTQTHTSEGSTHNQKKTTSTTIDFELKKTRSPARVLIYLGRRAR